MTPDDIRWPVLYSGGFAIHFEPDEHFGAYFGGPLEQLFRGKTFGPEPLHRILTFVPGIYPQPPGHYLQGLMGLFFGMRYDGCCLRYRLPVLDGVNAQYIESNTKPIEVLEMSPTESHPSWPYVDYPRLLPYIPLREASRTELSVEDFAQSFTWQGLEHADQYSLVVVVPSIPRLGVSLWGRGGDDENVLIVFEYNYATREVVASTQCT